jgi:6-phosphogluconolactonase
MSRILLYVGTYTHPEPFLKSATGQGIYLLELDPETGALTPIGEPADIDSPSFLAISPDENVLYAVSEVSTWPEGTVTAYKIDRTTGSLTFINKQGTLGRSTTYVSVDPSNRVVMVANYGDGRSAAIFPIRPDGGVAQASDSVAHSGTGLIESRQDKPHSHSIQADPTHRFAYVADLGIDKIMIYQLDTENGRLLPNTTPSLDLPPGTGPRHFAFHPNGRFAYVIGELNSSITTLAVDSETGSLKALQTVPTLPEGVDPASSHASDIHIHPSGKFIYGGNRGHDSLVIYAVDNETGHLTYRGHQSSFGSTPRNFAIDPTGRFLLVANQNSGTIITFRIDLQTGALHETGNVASIPTPVCLKMLEAV